MNTQAIAGQRTAELVFVTTAAELRAAGLSLDAGAYAAACAPSVHAGVVHARSNTTAGRVTACPPYAPAITVELDAAVADSAVLVVRVGLDLARVRAAGLPTATWREAIDAEWNLPA